MLKIPCSLLIVPCTKDESLEDSNTTLAKLTGFPFSSTNEPETYFGSIIWEQTNQWDTREFSITLRYKFNTTKSKYKGTGAANDELRRL